MIAIQRKSDAALIHEDTARSGEAWLDAVTRIYNAAIGQKPRRFLALTTRHAPGVATVQFGYHAEGGTILDPEVMVHTTR